MFVAVDQGDYFRIPSDDRDLNYEKFNEVGRRTCQKSRTIILTIQVG